MARIILSTCFARRTAWADDYDPRDAVSMPLRGRCGNVDARTGVIPRQNPAFARFFFDWHGTCLTSFANKEARRRQGAGLDQNLNAGSFTKANKNRCLSL